MLANASRTCKDRVDVQEAGIKVPPVAASMISRKAEHTPKIKMAQARTFLVGYLLTWMRLTVRDGGFRLAGGCEPYQGPDEDGPDTLAGLVQAGE